MSVLGRCPSYGCPSYRGFDIRDYLDSVGELTSVRLREVSVLWDVRLKEVLLY